MKLFVFAVVLIGTAAQADDAVPIWKLQAEAKIAADMRDSGSAQFSDLTRRGHTVCGSVNAKNGYNGFAGSMRFAIVSVTPGSAKNPFNGVRDSEEVVFATDPATADLIIEICRGQY